LAAALVLVALLLGVVGTTAAMMRARAAEAEAVTLRKAAEQDRTVAMENEARADQNVARMYQVKGDFVSAEPMLRRASEIYRTIRGPEHADVAAALTELANLQHARGDFKSAESTYTESLAMFRRLQNARAAPDDSVANALERLGSLYISASRPEEAERTLRQSLDLFSATVNPDPKGLGSALGDLGMLLYRKGDVAEAEALLVDSLTNWRKVKDFEKWVAYDISAIAQTLAKIHESRGDKDGALPYARQYYLIQIAHISMGIAAAPNDSSFLRGRAEMYGHVGKFAEMAADLERLIRFAPGDHLLYMEAACARLYLGDDSGYRDLCQRMLRRFGASPDARVHDRVAKTCLAGPGSMDNLGPVIGIARFNIDATFLKTVPGATEVTPLFRLCAAMAEYRAGKFQQCLDLLDEPTQKGLSIEPRATAHLFRAMSYRRLKDDAEAHSAVDQARALFARISPPTADLIDPDATIQDWLIAQSVRREAEAMIARD
jgi:tetratricopeptide (TPR) repeat protein